MASLSTDGNGLRKIQFKHKAKRRTVYLGEMTLKNAKHVKDHIAALVSAALSQAVPDPKVSEWVASIPDWLAEKLAAVELIAPREKRKADAQTVDGFIDEYLSGRVDVKPGTMTQLRQSQKNLREFIGEKLTLSEFTPGHADAYKASLASRLADNSVRRNLGRGRQFFEAAVRKRLIEKNPFSHIRGVTVKGNAERFRFVTLDEIKRVIDAAPDAQWRLIIALARFGGLRTPSETLALKWSDVDWERQRIRIPSSKTENCGKASRVIPLFPELLPYLLDASELAAKGTEHVITRYRDASQNLRTKMFKIIHRAGMEPWERVFHNLRASRQTELAKTYPAHVVCSWMGNSVAVATEHYLHLTESDFDSATTNPTQNPTYSGAEIGEMKGIVRPAGNPEMKKPRDFAGFRSGSSRCNRYELPDQDLNLDKQNQNLLCYRYTIGYRSWAESSG